ncbi:MAG: hypothetical protein IOD12_14820, partial [Silvanigrellales bacterium]|nr:hypothetical protein [Silvanigrellales bacterium]
PGSFVKANAAAWDFDNAPTRFGPTGSLAFSELPMEGKVAHPPFSGHSWKERQGGIAYRWLSGTRAWDYTPPSADQVKGFSEAQLRGLSPAEKLDLLTGRGEFPTVFSERERNDANGLSWYGLCHGWALSAALFREPAPIVMTSPSGVRIPFGSADIKALLAYYAGEALFSRRQFVGLRCWGNAPGSPACRDMNAGAFHILLANEVGRKNRSFVVELSADEEIWNKPVLSYTSQVEERRKGASAGAAPGTKEEVTVRTSVTYVHNSEPQWEAEPKSDSLKTYSYLYRLELAEGGVVVGGQWLQDFFPDFAWTLEDRTPFASIPPGSPLAGLRELYVAATGDVCAVDASKCHSPSEPSGKLPWCPEGYTAERTPAGMEACAKGDDIFGPITPNMRDACRLSGRGAACESAVWPRTLYFAAAGNERCQRGSEWDSTFAQCTNDMSVFGPFSQNLWSICKVLSESDRQQCSAMQWQSELFSRVFKEGAF